MKYFTSLMLALGLTTPALAQDHKQHEMSAVEQTDNSPSTKAYMEANEKMHKDMMTGYTGDADVDFVRGMIPHHQGAIDMAKVQLKYGKDPEITKLAKDVIAAQEKEIKMMEDWLAEHDKK